MAHDDHKNTIKGCLFKICFCRVPEQSVILFFVSRYCVALNRSGYSSVHPFRSSFVRICILLDYKSSPLPADAAADRVSYLHSLSVMYKTESCQSNVDLKHTSFDPSALLPHPAICINPLIYTNLCVSHSEVFFAFPMSCLVLPLCIEPTPTISPYQPYAWVVYQHRPPRCSEEAAVQRVWRQIGVLLSRSFIKSTCFFSGNTFYGPAISSSLAELDWIGRNVAACTNRIPHIPQPRSLRRSPYLLYLASIHMLWFSICVLLR